jgi:hypothetical protein
MVINVDIFDSHIELWWGHLGIFGLASVLATFSKIWEIFSKLSGHPVLRLLLDWSHIRAFTLVGSSLVTNVRLVWKWMALATALAYYNTATVMAVKSFIVKVLEPWYVAKDTYIGE